MVLILTMPLSLVAVISGLQLVVCSISIRDIKINVSAKTQQPFSPPLYSADVLWKNWTFPQGLPTYDPRLIAVSRYLPVLV